MRFGTLQLLQLVWYVLLGRVTAALLFFPLLALSNPASGESFRENVVLLHGLARSADSMNKLQKRLDSAGYNTCNVSYPSRHYSVEVLAAEFVLPAIESCFSQPQGRVHFVTHSMGGIIVRQLSASGVAIEIGRVVMLAPPNAGSEVVDKLGDWSLFRLINGPAGSQLGTASDALPAALGPARFELGIVTGSRTINFFLSTLIAGEDDGKVSIENAKLEGMTDFIVVPVSHPFIMKDTAVGKQVVHFLQHGKFIRP